MKTRTWLNECCIFSGNHNLLLVAGGVGINPMASIFRHAAASQATSSALSKVKLIYSARTADELIFKDSFDAISRENPSRFSAEYFVTREDCNNSGINHGRFTSKNLKDSLTGNLFGTIVKIFYPSNISNAHVLAMKMSCMSLDTYWVILLGYFFIDFF